MEKPGEKVSKAQIRSQVEKELANKKQCCYSSYECSNFALDCSKYCRKHILNDKNSPFKRCNFVFQNNGKRCHLPAAKSEKKDYRYCNEHALKVTLAKDKQNSKNPPPISAESLLSSLTHYVKKFKNPDTLTSSYLSEYDRSQGDISEARVVRVIDPFVDIDAPSIYTEQCNEVLNMCSESESDVEPSTYATVWHDAHVDSSDDESIDSEEEDPLKHANVYTAEEVAIISRDKLVKLQSLYIEQYKHMRHLLKERRRKFLHSLKREKETCCNINNQVRDNPKEQRMYKKLKQYNKYQKAFGTEAILEKKLHDLRARVAEGMPAKSPSYTKCQFTEGGVKCSERAVPLAKHCRKHILEDPHQVLFKACGRMNGDIECNTPVEAIFDDSTCKLHMDIPLLRSYSQPRTSQGNKCLGQKESESDADDSLDLPTHYLPTNENVKTDIMDYSIPVLEKMELPSVLFEDSIESLQYPTSEFPENFTEQSSLIELDSSDIKKESQHEVDIETTPTDDDLKLEIDERMTETVDEVKTDPSIDQAASENAEDIKPECGVTEKELIK